MIGDTYRILGMFPQAEQHLPRATAICVRILGETDPSTLNCVHSLGLLYQYQGRWAEAEARLLEVLDVVRLRKDEEQPYALAIAANLANLYLDWGRYPEGEAVCLETLPRMRRVLGEEHRNTLKCKYFLSQIYIEQARYAEAEPLCLESLLMRVAQFGVTTHPDTGLVNNFVSVDFCSSLGIRSSNMMAKWLRAAFQFWIGIVHFFDASWIAM